MRYGLLIAIENFQERGMRDLTRIASDGKVSDDEIRFAAAFAMFIVWTSSDSRTPRRRPSMIGRMPTLGNWKESQMVRLMVFVAPCSDCPRECARNALMKVCDIFREKGSAKLLWRPKG